MGTPKRMTQRQNDSRTFNQFQVKGAAEFGAMWLIVNRLVTETASLNGIDVLSNKTALTAIAYSVCRFYQSWETPIAKGGAL